MRYWGGASPCRCCLVRSKKRGKNRSLRPWPRRYVTSVYTQPAPFCLAPPAGHTPWPDRSYSTSWHWQYHHICLQLQLVFTSNFILKFKHGRLNWLQYWAPPCGGIFCLPDAGEAPHQEHRNHENQIVHLIHRSPIVILFLVTPTSCDLVL